jgi:hypothetical protein
MTTQVADWPWRMASFVPSPMTIVAALLLVGVSLAVFTLISLEAAVCTFSATLTPGACS